MSRNKVIELFGRAAIPRKGTNWAQLVRGQRCPFLGRKCIKVRKSQPEVSIGTGAEGNRRLVGPRETLPMVAASARLVA